MFVNCLFVCFSRASKEVGHNFVKWNVPRVSKIYFVIKLYMFRASSVPIIRSYLLYARQLVRFMRVMWPLPSRVRLDLQFQPDSAWKRSHNPHETYQLPYVQQITPDDGHRRWSKHVEFYDEINFGYLMHLVGCFIRNLSRCTVTRTWCTTRVLIASTFVHFLLSCSCLTEDQPHMLLLR
jgi:hypothetical protein